MNQVKYLLGIDGGGTGCRARLTDLSGRVLGEGSAGPANIALGVDVATGAILDATRAALAQAGLGEDAMRQTSAGLGIAAANVPRHRRSLEEADLPFLRRTVHSDAEVACIGAHRGKDGGILILGTGSQGVVQTSGNFRTVGGWGFALSDSGSGAILGRATVRRAMYAMEGVEAASPLTQAVLARFDNDREAMLQWSSNARPKDWAEFARHAFDHAARGDAVALKLVRDNTLAAERMLDRMIQLGAARIALMGGIAKPTLPYLAPRYAEVIVEPEGDAMDGALLVARESR